MCDDGVWDVADDPPDVPGPPPLPGVVQHLKELPPHHRHLLLVVGSPGVGDPNYPKTPGQERLGPLTLLTRTVRLFVLTSGTTVDSVTPPPV